MSETTGDDQASEPGIPMVKRWATDKFEVMTKAEAAAYRERIRAQKAKYIDDDVRLSSEGQPWTADDEATALEFVRELGVDIVIARDMVSSARYGGCLREGRATSD